MTLLYTKSWAYRSLVVILLILITGCGSSSDLPRLSSSAVILAFGDSLTRGKGAEDNQSYPAVLEKMINRKVINAGINGELSEEGLSRLPAYLEQHSPDLLILCHGGNDILRKRDMNQMGNNVRQMINLASQKNIPVILLGVPRPGLFLSSEEIYSEIAESTDVIFIEDVISDVLSDNSMKSDMAHPNHAGYKFMAEAIYEVLQDNGAI